MIADSTTARFITAGASPRTSVGDQHVLADHRSERHPRAPAAIDPNANRKPGIIGRKISIDSLVCASL